MLTQHQYDKEFVRGIFHMALLVQQAQLAPPISVSWRRSYGAPPTLYVQVHDDAFASWLELIDGAVVHSDECENELHVHAEGVTSCFCDQRMHVITVTDLPSPCELTSDGWCTVHSTSDGPVYCKTSSARRSAS